MSDMAAEHHDNWKPASNPWAVATVVTLAVFMEILDTTIVNVALPHVAGSLSSSYDESTWVLTSYLVANGIVLPISAFLSRLFGRKQFFLICIVMFTICSFLCGIATELWEIILFRVMQGFFGGGLQPTQQSVLLGVFHQYPGGHRHGAGDLSAAGRPALGAQICRKTDRRLDRHRPYRAWPRLPAGHARSRRRRRLVLLELYPHLRRADDNRHHRGDFLARLRQKAGGGFALHEG